MKHTLYLVLSLCLIVNAKASIQREWEDFSDPSIMNSSFEKSFAALPLAGHVTDLEKLWANDYWPRKRGSINYRWNAQKPEGFDLVSPTKAQAQMMSFNELSALAPSEKMDLLNGNYDYPLKEEVSKVASKSAPLWHGICNGWSPAAINHNEPLPKTLINPDGIAIPFGSSDIKALLSYYYAYKHEVRSTHQMGKRCNFFFGPNCDEDLNAGAFHIVLTNKVGLSGTSFIADVERKRQVWNHAISEYQSTIVARNLTPEKDSAPGTVQRIRVKTDMTFVQAIKENSWTPVLRTPNHINGVRNYEYFLDIDASGKIIGGEWESNARPDFMWEMEKASSFKGDFARLSDLLND